MLMLALVLAGQAAVGAPVVVTPAHSERDGVVDLGVIRVVGEPARASGAFVPARPRPHHRQPLIELRPGFRLELRRSLAGL